MTEIKQTAESLQVVPVERPEETASPAEPAHVERVTKKKAKDPKKAAAGRAGAAARQKRLLEQHEAAKESLRPPVSAADNNDTSASPKEAKRIDERPEPNWIPWIIGACLAGGSLAYVFAGENMRLRASPASMAAGPKAKVKDKPPQLTACPDPTLWNKTMTTPATDGKMLVHALYHSAVVSGLAAGYARLGKMAIGGSPPKLDFTPRDVGIAVVDVALTMASKDMLI